MKGKKMPDEIADFIRENFSGRTNAELAQLVNQKFGTCYSKAAIENHKSRQGLRQPPLFPETIQEFIRANYHGCSYRDLALQINQTFGTSYTTDQVQSNCWYHKLFNGRIGKARKPLGHEMLLNGYRLVKVTNRPIILNGLENYRYKHQLVWEQANGPIPPGHVIIFLDGDKTNCSLENLQLITKAESCSMSMRKLFSSDPEITKTGVLIAKIAVAAREKEKELKS